MRSGRASLLSLVLALVLGSAAIVSAADQRASTRADLIAAIRASRAAPARRAVSHEAGATRAAPEDAHRRGRRERGFVPRREVEDSEQALATARAKLAATRQEMVVTDHSLVEALVTDRPAPAPSRQGTTPLLVRYRGATGWSLAAATQTPHFFTGP